MEYNYNSKVSIIIPIYNGSRYMCEAINSAILQSYPNVEVIVVNDGSNDNEATEKIALSYGEKIRYFAKENGGVATALNLGIKKMTGDYFSWLSHDDVYHPNKIEIQIEFLIGNHLEDTILYGGYDLIDSSSKIFQQVKPDSLHSEEKLNMSLFPILRGLINGCSLLIHKSHFERSGLFNEKLLITQDYDLWFKMFRNANVKFLPGIFLKTRLHDEQSSKRVESSLTECNSLWTSFLNEVSVKEMCELDGSPYLFYKNTADFLQRFTPYSHAQQYAESLAKNAKGKISIIIPFFNRIPTLIEAINSVLFQTYTNFEVLLIDDGSTDDLTPLKIFKDTRLHYIHQEHKGVSAARNLGISLSSGEYIAFLDSDDIFLPGKLEKQIDFMETHELYFSHTSYQRMDIKGNPMEVINSGRFSGVVFPLILSSCGIATPTVMLKKEILNNRRFKETIEFGEDVCLWIDLAYSYPFGGIEEPLSKVRVTSYTSAFSMEKQRIACLNIANHIIKNPRYVVHKHEIHLLQEYYLNLFS